MPNLSDIDNRYLSNWVPGSHCKVLRVLRESHVFFDPQEGNGFTEMLHPDPVA